MKTKFILWCALLGSCAIFLIYAAWSSLSALFGGEQAILSVASADAKLVFIGLICAGLLARKE